MKECAKKLDRYVRKAVITYMKANPNETAKMQMQHFKLTSGQISTCRRQAGIVNPRRSMATSKARKGMSMQIQGVPIIGRKSHRPVIVLLTAKQAAKGISCHPSSISPMIRCKTLAAFSVNGVPCVNRSQGGKSKWKWLFAETEVQRYIDAHRKPVVQKGIPQSAETIDRLRADNEALRIRLAKLEEADRLRGPIGKPMEAGSGMPSEAGKYTLGVVPRPSVPGNGLDLKDSKA